MMGNQESRLFERSAGWTYRQAERGIPASNGPITTALGATGEFPRAPVHLSGPNVPDVICELLGLDAGILRVRSERRILDASPLTVSFDRIQLSGVVTGCQPIGDEWTVSIALTVSRRREARFPVNRNLTVGIIREGGSEPSLATVVNYSASGFCLGLSHPVKVASRIYVETESEMILGEVRHCYRAGDFQFVIGVLIVEVIPDVRTQGKLVVFWDKFRWRLASAILGSNPLPRPS